jgi:TonB family protein
MPTFTPGILRRQKYVSEKILDMRLARADTPAFSGRLVLIKKGGEDSMRLSVASSALAAAFVLTPVAAGYAPALCQDFSITNQVAPAIPGHPDLMRQLQAWWDAHAYYPSHASNNDEGGTVKVHLVILSDGRIWTVDVTESSGSHSLDTAGATVFRGGSVRPFPEGEPKADADINISLHYILAHRHDQPVAAGYTPVVSKGPFTITNDPVKSPVLETMLQRTCAGTVWLNGIPNHPEYGMHSWAQAIFFRKPDGTPWVKFYGLGFPSISPVTQVGKMVMWTGAPEMNVASKIYHWHRYTVWADGDNHLRGAVSLILERFGVTYITTGGGNSVDLTCAPEVLPTITWNAASAPPSILTSPEEPP